MKIKTKIHKLTFISCVMLHLSFVSLFGQAFDPNSVRSKDCKPGVFNCGYKPAPKEIQESIPLKRDFNSFEELPSKVDLSSQMPPVGNQGQQNSCVAWASGYAIKSYLAKSSGNFSDYDPPFAGGSGKNVFSPAFIYNQQNGGKDEGLYYYKTMEFLQKSGVAPWSSMPYTDKDYLKQPQDSVKQEALNYRIKSYSRLNIKKPDDIKRVLAQGNVVLFGVIIDDAFYNLKGSAVYDANGGKSYGGHAMTIVGYDDNKTASSGRKGAFKFQNSWGPNWGDKGFGWISYAMLAKTGQEAYSIIDEKKTTPTPTIVTQTPVRPLSPPTEIKISRGEFDSKIVLTWDAISGSLTYLVQRREQSDSADQFVDLAYVNSSTMTDSNVTPSTTYYYRVISFSAEESSVASKEVEGYTSAKVNTMSQFESVVGIHGQSYMAGNSPKVSLTWSDVDGATGYIVAKMGSNKRWKNIGNVSSASFIDSNPSKTETNIYRIAASQKGKKVGEWSETYGVNVGSDDSTPGQVSNLVASSGEYANKVKLSWSEAPGAITYFVFRFDQNAELSGQYQVNGTSFEDSDQVIQNGNLFAYAVISANRTGYSEPSEVAIGNVDPGLSKRSAGATLPPPENVSYVLNQKDKNLKISWKAVKDSNEYYVYRKIIKKGSNPKNAKFAFVNAIPAKQTFYTEVFEGNPGDLYFYSIRSKSEFGSESKDSKPVSIFLNAAPSQVKKRALSLEELPKSFVGTWSGMFWNPKLGPQNLTLEINGEHQDFKAVLKINDKIAKQYQGSWSPGSSGIKTDGFLLDLSREMEGNANVKLVGISDLGENNEFSFNKE